MEKLRANVILEILGRPKEHLTQSLNELISKLGSEKGVKIFEKNIHEPIKLEETKDLFTTFAEIIIELDSLENYFGIMFAYMPSNIEIVSPEKLTLNNTDLNELASKLMHRLHDYDAITKKALYENSVLVKKLQELTQNTPNKNSITSSIKRDKKEKSGKSKKTKNKSG